VISIENPITLPETHPLAQSFTQKYAEALGELKKAGISTTAFLRAGAIFNTFNPETSDLDIFVIVQSTKEKDLEQVFKAYQEVGQQEEFTKHPNLLRHPPTVLTPEETRLYLKAHAAKIAFPLVAGIYQPFFGEFDEDLIPHGLNWPIEFLYGSQQFLNNIKKIDPSSEDAQVKLRKQIIYFLRFMGVANLETYAPQEKDVIASSTSINPHWPEICAVLKTQGVINQEFLSNIVNRARKDTQETATRLRIKISPQKTKERNKLAQLAWTIEKTRWDLWLVDDEKTATEIISGNHGGVWGFNRRQVISLLGEFGTDVSELRQTPTTQVLPYFQGAYATKLRKALRTTLKACKI